jgi:hypothetical protein
MFMTAKPFLCRLLFLSDSLMDILVNLWQFSTLYQSMEETMNEKDGRIERYESQDRRTKRSESKAKKKTGKKRNYEQNFVWVTEILGRVCKLTLELWCKSQTAKKCNELSAKSRAIRRQIHGYIEARMGGEEAVINTRYHEHVSNA